MNERTKQLWEESQQWNGSDDGRSGLKILESVEKFAELIVKECADIGRQYADGNYEVYNQILEHFGIEE